MRVIPETAPWRSQITDETLARWSEDVVAVSLEEFASSGVPPKQCIVITDKMDTKSEIEQILDRGVRHIIQSSNIRFDHAVNVAAQMIAEPQTFLANPAKAFFELIRGGSPFVEKRFAFRVSKEKDRVLQEIRSYLDTVDSTRVVRDPVHSIADELFTNAIFNAPADKSKRPKFAKLQRNLTIELEPGVHAEMFLAHDDKILLVGCEDPYGTIDPLAVVHRLHRCYSEGASSVINLGPGGSGIGCFLMLEQSSSYFVLVSPGKKTVVCSALPLGLPAKLTFSVPKNIHLIPVESTP